MSTQPQMTAGSPRQLVLVAGLVGVLLLIVGLLVVRPLLGGTEEDQATPPAVTVGAASTATTATTTQLIPPSTSVTPSADAVASAKDPFRPLVNPSAATEAAVTASGDTGSVIPSTVAATGSTVAGAGAGTASTPGGGATAEHQVALVNIKGGSAKVTVDGTAYTVEEGETFAGDYRAVDIGRECASFESGTTPFTLCEGEAVLK